MRVMPLRIACDLDGTVADMSSALQREADSVFGPGVDLRGTEPPPEASALETEASISGKVEPKDRPGRGLSNREHRQLWAHIRAIENFWCTLEEIEPGAVARLAVAAARHGWEIIFLTERPETAGELAQIQSQRWLEAHGFELPSVFVVNGSSRGKIAAALQLDAVIDDRPENCVDVAVESKARALLICRDPRRFAPPGAARMGIEMAFSFGAALDCLEELSTRAARPGGLVGKVRRTLGI